MKKIRTFENFESGNNQLLANAFAEIQNIDIKNINLPKEDPIDVDDTEIQLPELSMKISSLNQTLKKYGYVIKDEKDANNM
jgi:hypothetical protein